jgi:hypothetical protein
LRLVSVGVAAPAAEVTDEERLLSGEFFAKFGSGKGQERGNSETWHPENPSRSQ